MPKITDYTFLLQKTFGINNINMTGSFQLSSLNSSSIQAKPQASTPTVTSTKPP